MTYSRSRAVVPERTLLVYDLDGTLLDSKQKIINDWKSAAHLLISESYPSGMNPDEINTAEFDVISKQCGIPVNIALKIVSTHRRCIGRTWTNAFLNNEVQLFPDVLPNLESLTQFGYDYNALVTRSDVLATAEKLSFLPEMMNYFMSPHYVTPLNAENKIHEIEQAVFHTQQIGMNLQRVFIIDDRDDGIKGVDNLRAKYNSKNKEETIEFISVHMRRGSTPTIKGFNCSVDSMDKLCELLKSYQS